MSVDPNAMQARTRLEKSCYIHPPPKTDRNFTAWKNIGSKSEGFGNKEYELKLRNQSTEIQQKSELEHDLSKNFNTL